MSGDEQNIRGDNVSFALSETEADEPSRGREIFQQKNTCDDKFHKVVDLLIYKKVLIYTILVKDSVR